MSTKMSTYVYGALLTLLFLSFPLSLFAAATYAVKPLVIDLDLEARDIVTQKITITNTGTQPTTLYPTVNNISVDGGGSIQEFIPAVMSDRTTSLASWIEISRAGIDIRQGETKSVDITFRINPNPVPGVYHAFVGFGSGSNRDEAEAQVARGDAPGTIVAVTIVDKKTSFLKLSRFLIDRIVTSSKNQAAAYTIKNPGEEVLTPSGEIILYDTKGVEVGTLPINTEQITIKPGEEHTFAAEVPTQNLFGKYKAFLSVEYGKNQSASVQDTVFFYVFPLKRIVPILIGLLVIAAIAAFFLHKKYFDDDESDGAEQLLLHVRESRSEAQFHDIDLKKS